MAVFSYWRYFALGSIMHLHLLSMFQKEADCLNIDQLLWNQINFLSLTCTLMYLLFNYCQFNIDNAVSSSFVREWANIRITKWFWTLSNSYLLKPHWYLIWNAFIGTSSASVFKLFYFSWCLFRAISHFLRNMEILNKVRVQNIGMELVLVLSWAGSMEDCFLSCS